MFVKIPPTYIVPSSVWGEGANVWDMRGCIGHDETSVKRAVEFLNFANPGPPPEVDSGEGTSNQQAAILGGTDRSDNFCAAGDGGVKSSIQ